MLNHRSALLLGAMTSICAVPALANESAGTYSQEATAVAAPDAPPEPDSDSAGSDDIIVTATKKTSGSTILATPLSVTGFGAVQIAEMNVKSLSDFTTGVPNVNLQSNASAPGFNNFSIRGLAVYSTVPSNTPTVGVFVDDVYQGTPAGAGWQTFDIEGVEVLRGPQGLFFGRNVTAGAILVRTTAPTKELSGRFEAGIESGPAYTLSGVISGPVTDKISAKVAAYYSDDQGYFDNHVIGRDVGKSKAVVLRGALSFEPTERFRSVFRLERAKTTGDSVVAQNQLATGLGKFEVEQNEAGFVDNIAWTASNRSDLEVGLGDGTLTNIFGWRKVHSRALSDIDSTPLTNFHLLTITEQEQWSNEFRYSGSFGIADVTAGLFYYWDDLNYIEDRTLLGGNVLRRGGGRQKSTTFAEFINVDLRVTSTITLNLGQRWSVETKKADIEPLTPTATSPCSLITETCSPFRSRGNSDRWKAFTPRIGFQYQPDADTNIYGFYTKGFRSGGFNLRNAGGAVPAYDQEVVKTFEVGAKKRFDQGKYRIAITAFRNDISDLQRDVLIPDPVIGNTQTAANTADVRIQGIEAEATAQLFDGFSISGDVGYLDSKFKTILFDLSGNQLVGPEDFALRLPYLSTWSYGARLNYRGDVGNGVLSAMLSYSYRSRFAYDDRNSGLVDPVKRLDATLGYTLAGDRLTLSVYGKNLLDRVEFTGHNPVSFTVGGTVYSSTFSPMSHGRVVGAKATYQF